jgi:hypothetical protein
MIIAKLQMLNTGNTNWFILVLLELEGLYEKEKSKLLN